MRSPITGCIVMSNINFDNAYLLLIAIPLIVLFTVPFVIAVRKDNRNGHNIASQIMHVVMAIIIAFAAAGTTITSVLTRTEIYVVADVSYSANKNLDTIDNYIKKLNLPRNSKVGLICFGADYELVCKPGDLSRIKSVKSANVDDSQTNIAEALEYAGTLFNRDVIKRVVLITDGRQTDERDGYAMRRAVDTLENKDVKVDAIFLDDKLSENAREVQISSAEFTRSAFKGREEEVIVSVRTNYAVNAAMYLYKNEILVQRRAIALTEGINSVEMTLDTDESGTYDYEVVVEADGDVSGYNNNYRFTQTVADEIKVLIVTSVWEECEELINQFGGNASIDIYENAAYRLFDKNEYAAKYVNNDKINLYCFTEGLTTANYPNLVARSVPVTIEELCKYDEIILSDVDITDIKNATEFVKNLDTVVSTLGKSLVTLGNMNIQYREEQELRDLNKMLPVRFGNNDEAPKLYTMVLDASRSMEGDRISAVKKIAAGILNSNMLSNTDEVLIITFYGDVEPLTQAPRPASQREELINLIENIEVKQGTVIGKGIEWAYRIIKDLDYSDKQVVLISDGLNLSGDDDPVEVVREMYSEGIVTSVVDIGRNGDNGVDSSTGEPNPSGSVSAEALALLRDIKTEGHGSYNYINALALEGQVPDNVFGEMAEKLSGDVVLGVDATVKINRQIDDVLAGLQGGMPDITGYVCSSAEASATTVLQINHVNGAKEKTVPLYSYWKYGNGKVSSFTTSFYFGAGDMNIRYWEGEVAEVFFDNVFVTNVPNEKNESPYQLDVIQESSYTRVQIVPPNLHFNARATVKVTNPAGEVTEREMSFDSYYYYYEFESAVEGKYDIEVTYSYNEADYAARSAVNVSYSSEYDAFAEYEANTLHKALNGRGQVSVDGKLTIENDKNESGTYVIDLALPLLIVTVVLFVVDIVVRKLKWEDVVSFFGGFRKSQAGSGGSKS